jgi:Zn-dependent protease with chaperone function
MEPLIMFTRITTRGLLCAAALLAGRGALAAEQPTQADRELVGRVAARMFASAEPVEGWAWPPLVYIVNYMDGSADEDGDGLIDGDEINADASLLPLKPGEQPEYPEGTSVTLVPVPGVEHIEGTVAEDGTVQQPVIRIYQGWLTYIARGEDDQLANCFGHELAHVLLGHVSDSETQTALVENARQRQQEAAADVLGFKLAVAADFAYDALIASLDTEMEVLGGYSAFQAYMYNHPGYLERRALIEERRAEVWRAMESFENGVFFLNNEQYELAADSFETVVGKQKNCYEAWANLGYAQLMRYCDSMDPEELRASDIGQLVVGGFYRRADSIATRGPSAELWEKAVEALQTALALNPELVLAQANLAAAYLVHPAGKDVGESGRLFAQVIAALDAGAVDAYADPLMYAALLVNAGVQQMADGDAAAAEALFVQARGLFESEEAYASAGQVASAVNYNRAMLQARSAEPSVRKSAIERFERYLTSNSSALTWWALAFDAYATLCREQGVEPKTRETLAAEGRRRMRMVTGIQLADGSTLSIDAPAESIEQLLGATAETTTVGNDPFVERLRYDDLGLELWRNNRLVAIRLSGANAPALSLQALGPASGATATIRVGMTFDEVLALVGRDGRQWDKRYGTNPMIVYHYFHRLGFGVRVNDSGRVTEIIVAQLPEKAVVS